MTTSPVTPIDSASVLVVRDTPSGIEVLMTERPSTMGFAAGALVFPGGKLDEGDRDPYFSALCGVDCNDLHMRVAVLRELFEETALLLADDVDIASAREQFRVCDSFMSFCQALRPRIQLENLLYFSRWITPSPMPKRFDTRFYLAVAPSGQVVEPDPREIVRAEWMRPQDALDREQGGEFALMFPTRMNLKSLSRFPSVQHAFDTMSKEPVVTVEPEVVKKGEKIFLKIPPVEGYGLTEIAREDIGEFMRQHGTKTSSQK